MADKPEALRLADRLESDFIRSQTELDAAAELRRLHAENERLHQINQPHEMKLSVQGYEIQIADLKAVNAELLAALKLAQSIIGHPDDAHSRYIAAAIAKTEGQQ